MGSQARKPVGSAGLGLPVSAVGASVAAADGDGDDDADDDSAEFVALLNAFVEGVS